MKKVYIAPSLCVADFEMDDTVLISMSGIADDSQQLIKQIDLQDEKISLDADNEIEDINSILNDVW